MPFHISPRNGVIRECKAEVKPCPYGLEFHAPDKESAKATKAALIAARPPVPRGGIDKLLRPAGSSTSGFMGIFETYDGVVAGDMAYLHEQGIFPSEVGEMLKKLVRTTYVKPYQDKDLYKTIAAHVADDVKIEVGTSMYMGYQSCPWQEQRGNKQHACSGGHSGHNVKITSPRGIIYTNELAAHLIGEHNFFQGKHSEYRLDPARLLHVLGWH